MVAKRSASNIELHNLFNNSCFFLTCKLNVDKICFCFFFTSDSASRNLPRVNVLMTNAIDIRQKRKKFDKICVIC